jgi:structure-specific recognition protein 1
MESFQNIYLDVSKQPGRLRIADYGMGWKPVSGEGGLSLDPGNFGPCQWSRSARGYEMKVFSRSQGVIQLDGFQQDVSCKLFLFLFFCCA